MKFIKCKNDLEKLQAIREYCEKQIESNNYNINFYKAEQVSKLDYAEEIHNLELENMRFNTILKIIFANEFTSVFID